MEDFKGIPNRLYRGVRPEEKAAGRLLAKVEGPFVEGLKVPFLVGDRTVIGPSIDNAAKNHQKDVGELRGKFKTSGVSTTTDRAAAVRFATENGTRDGYVAVILRDLLARYGVSEYDVASLCSDVQNPADQEVILFMENGGPFPKEIIEEFQAVAAKDFGA